MIRILIVDDANLIRQALSIYFKPESDLEIVGIAENGKTALKLVEELNPDIVLMDMEMPEMDGVTATNIINQRFPNTKVLMMSSHHSQDYIDKALTAGANGYFIKHMPTKELSEAIKLIYKQDVTIMPILSTKEGYVVLHNTLPRQNQAKPKLFSFSLANIYKFLSSLNHQFNKKRITVLFMLGIVIFLGTVLKHKIAVRANSQIRHTLELHEE